MPDHPPVLDYRRPTRNDPLSVLRVLGGVACIIAALLMLSFAGLGSMMLLEMATGKASDPVGGLLIGFVTTGVGILVALVSLHGAYAAFRPVKPAEDEVASDGIESAEDTDV